MSQVSRRFSGHFHDVAYPEEIYTGSQQVGRQHVNNLLVALDRCLVSGDQATTAALCSMGLALLVSAVGKAGGPTSKPRGSGRQLQESRDARVLLAAAVCSGRRALQGSYADVQALACSAWGRKGFPRTSRPSRALLWPRVHPAARCCSCDRPCLVYRPTLSQDVSRYALSEQGGGLRRSEDDAQFKISSVFNAITELLLDAARTGKLPTDQV